MLRLHGNLPSAEAVIFFLGVVAKGMTEPTYAKGCTTFKLGALNRCIVVAIIRRYLLSWHDLEGKEEWSNLIHFSGHYLFPHIVELPCRSTSSTVGPLRCLCLPFCRVCPTNVSQTTVPLRNARWLAAASNKACRRTIYSAKGWDRWFIFSVRICPHLAVDGILSALFEVPIVLVPFTLPFPIK